MKLSVLMGNEYIWLILAMCTIMSLIYAVYTNVKNRKGMQITYYRESIRVIRTGRHTIRGLTIEYKDRDISDLVVTKYAIWNSGSGVIKKEDVASEDFLSITSCSETTQILDVSIISMSESTEGFKVIGFSDDKASVGFDYINVKDGVVVQVVHTGRSDDLIVKCILKGGKKEAKLLNKKRKHIFVSKYFKQIIIIFSIIMVFWVAFVFSRAIRVVLDNKSLTSIIGSVCLLVSSWIPAIMSYSLIREVFKTSIPNTIRNEMFFEEYNE